MVSCQKGYVLIYVCVYVRIYAYIYMNMYVHARVYIYMTSFARRPKKAVFRAKKAVLSSFAFAVFKKKLNQHCFLAQKLLETDFFL